MKVLIRVASAHFRRQSMQAQDEGPSLVAVALNVAAWASRTSDP